MEENTPNNNQGQQPEAKKKSKFTVFLIFFAVFFLLFSPVNLGATTVGILWFISRGLLMNYGGVPRGSGSFTNVPPPYSEIFLDAGSKYGVQPAFIAAIFSAGEHNNTWPNPAGPWASSPKGAQGPFQFITSTWNAYGDDGNGDGNKDIQNLEDASFGGANYLKALGAGNNTVEEHKLIDAAAQYNSGDRWGHGRANSRETRAYVPRVMKAFYKFYQSSGTGYGGSTQNIISAAESYLGRSIGYSQDAGLRCGPIPYSPGPNGVTYLDCSGYITRIYKDVGIIESDKPCYNTESFRTAPEFIKITDSAREAETQAQPGDMILWNGPNHTVLYGGKVNGIHYTYETTKGIDGSNDEDTLRKTSNRAFSGHSGTFWGLFRPKVLANQ